MAVQNTIYICLMEIIKQPLEPGMWNFVWR